MKLEFNRLPIAAVQDIQTDSGILLYNFDPESPTTPADKDIITATTGDITLNCKPEYTDFGSDINNIPNDTMELKKITGWNCSISTTALTSSMEVIRLALGAADINVENSKVIPRRDLQTNDFCSIWWLGRTLNGDWFAVKVINALSTDGFSLKTTKDGKGNISLTITGHTSINDINTIPMEFYFAPNNSNEE